MKYAYFPGCSLTATAQEYNLATRAVMARLSASLLEIPDWTCCGASAAEAVDQWLALALPARNLAIAMRELPDLDVLVPCSACYLNLLTASLRITQERSLRERINSLLAPDAPTIDGEVRVRHLLDVLVNDIPADVLAAAVRRPLSGIRVAPYYGCQILRPFAVFDDPEHPTSMEPLLESLGAEIHDWSYGGRCCGASLMTTHPEAALPRVGRILAAAQGADAIVTVCPMCQMNLEAYQRKAGQRMSFGKPVTILYLPQLMGLAFGLPAEDLALHKNLLMTPQFNHRYVRSRVEVT